MSKLPKTVQIGHLTYVVDLGAKDLPANLLGNCDYQGCRICVREGMSDQQTRAVLLHEVLHAVSEVFGAKLKERQVLALETGLSCLFRDNPSLARQLSPTQKP